MGGTIDGAALRISSKRRVRLAPWLLVLLPLVVIFFLCYRPVMRLKAQPPPGFAEKQVKWDATRQSSENRAAKAYWQLAVNLVQWRFAFGSKLPAEPLKEFRLEEKDFPRNSVATAPATRLRYWNKLRTVWSQSEAWEQTYVWNTDWLRESLSSAVNFAIRLKDNILGRFGD